MRQSAVIFVACLAICYAKVSPKVKCTPDQMRIEVPISSTTKGVYIEGLRDYPDVACRPIATGTLAVLELDLQDVYRCAVTRAVNKKTGKQIYYQTLIIENVEESGHTIKETLHVKCSIFSIKNHTVSKRNVLPAGFQEPEEIEILTTNDTIGRAPEPILGVGVRQAGKLVTGELNVSPGTPLQMEIFLDKVSSPIYGLLVTHMQVTDTKAQEETIIYNGCSVDPYLFENFNTVDGDFLSAKFRAFKFPESTYVQFKGTVNVCLDKCKGVECSDGQIGYGRKRRAISELPADPNKIFEITITSFIKVGSENSEAVNEEKTYNNKKFIVGNQMTETDIVKDKTFFRGNPPQEVLELKEEEKYTSILADNSQSSSSLTVLQIPILLLAFFKLFL
ncbi:zona pelucida superfamily protein qsm [Leptinotarsa decemlineata]|uniref:zona pelucida superfamily protein qsm n=1 Tax=Leptinotarsa decemlineata TaxID=7539 RepID=UPI003D30AC5F